MRSEPRAWFDARQEEQRNQWPELKLATPDEVSQVDAYSIQRGELPSAMTRDTTDLAALIVAARKGDTSGPSWTRILNPPEEQEYGPVGPQGPVAPTPTQQPGIFERAGTALNRPAGFLNDLLVPKQVQRAVPSQPEIERGYNDLMASDEPVAFGLKPRSLMSAVELGTSFGTGVSTPSSKDALQAALGAGKAASVTASDRLFGIKPPTQGLSRADEALNTLKRTTGIGVPEDDIATPIMRERARIQKVAESQAARLGSIADDVQRAFPVDKAGRLTDLPGQPTIQDVAARLPQYEQYLDGAQKAAMQRLKSEVEPFGAALREQGVEIASRIDVQPGGFYLPRGNAAEEGIDAPLKVYAGRGMAGGKKGFERSATFDSMAEGIDAGYQYASFRDALQSYAKNAAARATDAWAVGQFKASGTGETAKETILRTQPGLAGLKATLDGDLQRLRGLAKGLDDRTMRTIERFINDPEFDSVDDLRAALPETVKRGQFRGDDLNEVQSTLAGVKSAIADLRPEWNKALERARMTRDRGGIGFSGLQGTTFPDEVANAANRFLNAEKKATGKGAGMLNAIEATNGLLRGLRATFDLSFMGIQGLLGAARHPKQYAQALGVAIKSLADPAAQGKFIAQFDDAARAAGRPDSAAWNAVGNRLGGTATEFEVRGALPVIPGKLQNAPIVKQSNRAFGVFGDTLRLAADDALYAARQNAGKAVGPDEMADIAKFSNMMTGYSERRFLGDVGQIMEFAPRFFQSQLDILGNAVTNKGIVGQESRRSLGTLIGVGTLLTVAANEARGKETEFDPTNPNFMRIRDVAGTDMSLFAAWDSLLRAVVNGAQGDFTYLARSKASPLVALAWDEISGKSFTGEDTRTPEYLLRQLLPFSLSDVGTDRSSAAKTAIGLTGVKATPLSPTDQVEAGNYDRLPPEEQFRALKPQAWKVTQGLLPANMRQVAEEYDSLYDWYQAAYDVYEERAIKAGKSPAEAQRIAETQTRAHPIYRTYLYQRKVLTNRWVLDNPAVAREMDDDQADLPPSERTFSPTKQQRSVIGAAE